VSASQTDSDASLIDSAQKLLSQLMTVLMNAQGQSSQPQQDAGQDGMSPADRVASMDSDGDGMVTQAEFVAARPDDVSEEQATSLFASFDSEDAGTLSVDTLSEAMAQGPGQAPPGPPPPSDSGDDAISSLLSTLDSDGDGMVTEAEFVAARPDDVSEEQATSLFASFDSEDAGTLSVDALSEAMAQGPGQAPPGPPPPSDTGDDTLSSLFSTLDSDGDGVVSQEEFLAARPDDVSEDQASALFESLDTEGTGSLSEDQFVAGLRANFPPPPPFTAYAADDDASASSTRMTL